MLHHKDVFVSHVLVEIEYDRSVFLWKVNSESSGVLEYAGVERIGIRLVCLRMFIHFDVGMDVESLSLGKER